jgi:hypothetical protein
MQIKVNLLKENMVAMFFSFHVFWPLCFMCSRIFDFVFDFWSQNMLIAAPMQSERLFRGRIMQLHLKKFPSLQIDSKKSIQRLKVREHTKHRGQKNMADEICHKHKHPQNYHKHPLITTAKCFITLCQGPWFSSWIGLTFNIAPTLYRGEPLNGLRGSRHQGWGDSNLKHRA